METSLSHPASQGTLSRRGERGERALFCAGLPSPLLLSHRKSSVPDLRKPKLISETSEIRGEGMPCRAIVLTG
jgi:hypothetical protein